MANRSTKTSKQINNLTIRKSRFCEKWLVVSPQKAGNGKRIVLAECIMQGDAEQYARDCTDFLTEEGKRRLKAKELTKQVLEKGYF